MTTTLNANIKSATVNIHKREITISFVMHMDDDNMAKADALAFYIGKGELNIAATPRQIQLPMTGSYDNLPIEK